MRLSALLFLTFLCTCGRAQTGEFEIHENGYIYPEATMTDLAFIVDSLDLKFRQCDNLDDLNRMTGVYLLRFMAKNHGKEETDQRYTRALATAVAGLEAEWAKLVEVE